MDKCKHCGKPIVWEVNKNGTPVPCEPGAIYYIPDKEGTLTVLTKSGELVKARKGSEAGSETRVGMIPHFVNCTNFKRYKRSPLYDTIEKNHAAYVKKKEAEKAKEEAEIKKKCEAIYAKRELEKREKQISMLPEDFIGWARS